MAPTALGGPGPLAIREAQGAAPHIAVVKPAPAPDTNGYGISPNQDPAAAAYQACVRTRATRVSWKPERTRLLSVVTKTPALKLPHDLVMPAP